MILFLFVFRNEIYLIIHYVSVLQMYSNSIRSMKPMKQNTLDSAKSSLEAMPVTVMMVLVVPVAQVAPNPMTKMIIMKRKRKRI